MATQEQKDKKVAAAQKKVDSLTKRLAGVEARIAKATETKAALDSKVFEAERTLAYVKTMPVTGVFEPEVEQDDEPEVVEAEQNGQHEGDLAFV